VAAPDVKVAGNANDERDAHGVLIHRYGPHIFHTNAEKVFAYLSRFTGWRAYEHRVLADVGGVRVPMPINRSTLNALYGLRLGDEAAAQAFLDARGEPRARVETSEDAVVAKVGRALYETLFRGYTRKQWGSTRRSRTPRSARASRCASTTTTAASATPSSACPPTATRRCSSGCSTTR
jgi:UDP-galactopyranose mutase